jgi:preprotein translocase subunit SecD
MKSGSGSFNIYLLLAWTAAVGAGCASPETKDQGGKKVRRQEAVLRLHLEANREDTEHVTTATVGRAAPFTVTVEKKSFLTESDLVQADVVEARGGYVIALQFDRNGAWTLDQYSTANKGRRIAIWAEFGETRWIAAPRITQRMADGKIIFTPDVTREEAEKIVDGVNYVAEKIRKGRK